MATLRSTLQLYDGMSAALMKTYSSVNLLLSGFESMKASVGDAFPEAEFASARNQIQQAETAVTGLGQKLQQVDEPIRQASSAQASFNTQLNSGSSSAGKLLTTVKNLVGAYVGLQTGKEIISLTDTMTSASARLNYINDGLQTTAELQEKIYQAANDSRGSYTDMLSAVSKLETLASSAFSSNDEAIKFVSLMNKAFVDGNASAEEMTSAMYQLTQSMASGKLQGDEFRTISEAAPILKNAVDAYTKGFQQKAGMSLKELASEGLLTADVIKNALFSAEGEITEQFENMPMTFAQSWTIFTNKVKKAFQPVFTQLGQLSNSTEFQEFLDGIARDMAKVALITLKVFKAASKVAAFFSDNWTLIRPIIMGIVAALLAYRTALLISNIITATSTGLSTLAAIAAVAHGAAITEDMLATTGMTAAQLTFNAALYACPLVWILGIIILIIAVFYVVIALINKITGSSLSATGMIAGGIFWIAALFKNLGLTIANFAIGVWTAINAICANIGTAFSNTISGVQSWWYNLLSTVLNVVAGICEALNKLPFVSFDYSGITSAADEYAAKSAAAAGSKEDYQDISDAFNSGNSTYDAFSSGWSSKAYNSGYAWGSNFENTIKDKISSLTGSGDDSLTDDYLSSIDGNTSDIADSVELSEEDLKTLRDLAEMESIQNFVTLTPTVQVSTGDIKSGDDVDSVVAKIERALTVEIAASSAQLLGVSA